jgi:hypothetical protein
VQYYIETGNCEIAIWSKGKNPTLLEAMLSIGPNVSLENFIKIAPNFPDESIIEDEVIFTLSKSRSLFSLVRMEIFQEFTIWMHIIAIHSKEQRFEKSASTNLLSFSSHCSQKRLQCRRNHILNKLRQSATRLTFS